jgi:hypothetical protein
MNIANRAVDVVAILVGWADDSVSVLAGSLALAKAFD